PRRRRVLGGRRVASREGRRGDRVHRRAGCRIRPGPGEALPGQHRALQAAARIPLRRGAAEEQLRQGAEDRAAQAALEGYSPLPGSAVKYFLNLSGSSLWLSASGGGVPLRVML